MRKNPPLELAMLFMISTLCLLIFSVIGGLLGKLFLENGISNNPDILSNYGPATINFMKYLDIILRIGILGLPAFITPLVLKLKPLRFLNINTRPKIADISVFIMLIVIMFPFLEWLISFNMHLELPAFASGLENWMRTKESEATVLLEKFLSVSSVKSLLLNLFAIAVMPAILEELFFRGLLQNFLVRWLNKTHLAVFITAFLFSAIHLQFFGFLPRFLLGVLLGYMLVWTKNLWIPIIIHFLNNSATVIFVYLSNNNLIDFKINEPMNTNNLVIIISFAIAAGFFLLLAMYYQKKRDKTRDWINIYTTSKVTEAEIIRTSLEQAGINTVIINKRDSIYSSQGPVDVMVAPEDVVKAQELLQDETKGTEAS